MIKKKIEKEVDVRFLDREYSHIFAEYLNQILKIYPFSQTLTNRFISYYKVILLNANNWEVDRVIFMDNLHLYISSSLMSAK